MVATAHSDGAGQMRSLTGLRWVGAFGVFLVHLLWVFGSTPAGEAFMYVRHIGVTGVALFFVLSGYLLAQPGSTRGGTRQFWRRRFARVYPAYLFALAGMLLLVLGQQLRGNGRVPGTGDIASNAFLVQAWESGGTPESIVLPTWSLSVEVLFYILLPLVLAPFARITARRPYRTLAALTLFGTAVSVAFSNGIGSNSFPPYFLAVFFAGVWMAGWPHEHRIPGVAVALAVSVGLAVVVIGANGHGLLHGPASMNVMAAPYALLVGWLAHRDRAGLGSPLAGAVWYRLGLWSYCFFLLQIPVMFVAYVVLDTPPTDVVTALAIGTAFLVATVAVSAACYRFVEEPARRWLTSSDQPIRAGATPRKTS